MHTYMRNGMSGNWDVGVYVRVRVGDIEYSEFHAVQTFVKQADAAAFTNFLNGGDGDIRRIAAVLKA